jgi:hypothetical protein
VTKASAISLSTGYREVSSSARTMITIQPGRSSSSDARFVPLLAPGMGGVPVVLDGDPTSGRPRSIRYLGWPGGEIQEAGSDAGAAGIRTFPEPSVELLAQGWTIMRRQGRV